MLCSCASVYSYKNSKEDLIRNYGELRQQSFVKETKLVKALFNVSLSRDILSSRFIDNFDVDCVDEALSHFFNYVERRDLYNSAYNDSNINAHYKIYQAKIDNTSLQYLKAGTSFNAVKSMIKKLRERYNASRKKEFKCLIK